MVKELTTEAEFRAFLEEAGAKPVIIDFFADWCNPCKAIAPKVNDLASRNPSITFGKLNVDKVEAVATQYSVTALPSFVVFVRSQKIELLSGGDPNKLEALVKKYASSGDGPDRTSLGGHMDLTSMISVKDSECLNESDTHNLKSILTTEPSSTYLESDCDEQLVIFITFSQNIKLHSLKIIAPFENAPKTIKIFANQPSPINFDAAEGAEGIQTLVLTPEDVTEQAEAVQLKYVKLQNVGTLTIFVHDNQAGSEVTKLNRLMLLGSPVVTTNMTEFKRVAGKAGEGHE